MDSIFQNRIEADDINHKLVFMWPPAADSPFAGSDASIVDLDGDGCKEILIYDGGQDVRVVRYSSGALLFRNGADELHSLGYGVGPFKADHRLIFVRGTRFPESEATEHVPIPRIFLWTGESGFVDATGVYANNYRTNLLPELRRRISEENDPKRRKLYEAGLTATLNILNASSPARY